jgi:hypothetical protein
MNTHGGKREGAGRKPGPTANANERFMVARALKEESLARIRTMEADTQARGLIPAAEVESALAVAFSTVAQALLTLPDTMEREGLPPEAAATAERVIHAAMDGLADDLATLGFRRDHQTGMPRHAMGRSDENGDGN